MIHVVCFSGGKDSTALVLWAKDNLSEFKTVFCDTGWEHPITYAYVEEINQKVLGGKLIHLKSDKYRDGMRSLVQIKGRVPSTRARFCTENLKVIPMEEWLKTLDDDYRVYQGIRADESASRAKMCAVQFDDVYDCYVERPLFMWTATQCFEMMKNHGIKPNPLYLMGARRVGCFPYIMVSMRELNSFRQYPEIWDELKSRVLELEALCKRSFWSPGDIPDRFCSGQDKGVLFPWAHDVFRYLETVDEDQIPIVAQRTCMSVYNLCE